MRPFIPLAIGVLFGAIGGYFAGASGRQTGAAPLPGSDADTRPTTAPTADTSRPPDLAAVPARPAGARSTAFPLDLKDWFARCEKQQVQGTLAVWDTLATVYAHTRAYDALEAVLSSALAAGVHPTSVESIVPLVPPKEGLALLRRLRATFPKLAWNEFTYALTLLAAGEDAEGARLALASIDRMRLSGGVLTVLAGAVHRSAGARGAEALRDAFTRLKSLDLSTDDLGQFVTGAEAALGAEGAKPLREEMARIAQAEANARDADMRRAYEENRLGAIDETVQEPKKLDSWIHLGDAESKLGNRAAAYEAYRHANQLAPNDLDPIEHMIELDPREAVGLLEKRVGEIGDDAGVNLLVMTLLRLDRGREAGEAFFRISEPNDDDRLEYGFASLAPEAAVRRLTPYLAMRIGDRGRVLRALAEAYDAMGRRADALAALESSKGDGEESRYYPALVRLAPEQGVIAMATFVEREPKNSFGHIQFTRALRLTGRREEAKAALEKARPFEADSQDFVVEAALIDPEAGLAHLAALTKEDESWTRMLGDAYAEMGRGALARAAYDRYLADNPDDVEVLVRRCRCR